MLKRTPLKLSSLKFATKLRENKEDITLINKVESEIARERRYIFKLPKHGGSVVLLLSGGLDSIIAWHMLMGHYKLHVYPITVKNRVLNPQINSINFFNKYFKAKFPKLHADPVIVKNIPLDGGLISKIDWKRLPSGSILENYDPLNNNLQVPFWGTNIFDSLPAYSHLLSLNQRGINVDTIIYGVTADDGLYVPTQTFSFMRLMELMLIRMSGNNNLNFGSIFYDKELKVYMEKKDVLKYGNIQKLPLEKTYSCAKKGIIHCGSCLSCNARKYCFKVNGIKDKTIYLTDFSPSEIKNKVTKYIESLAKSLN